MIEINRQWKYAWVWKFLISWTDGVTVGFYPDYENCRFEVSLWTGKEKR